MNQEQLILRLRYGAGSMKDFIVRKYHRLTDFLSQNRNEPQANEPNVIWHMQCCRYVAFSMGIFHLFLSLTVIFGMVIMRTSSSLALQCFYDMLWFDIPALYIIWMSSGLILMFISVVGMIAVFKENFIRSGLHGVLLMITFVLACLASITALFLVVTRSESYYSNTSIDELLHNYSNYNSAQKMDYIQSTYQCCGGVSSKDWELRDHIPESCCTQSSYYQNGTCNNYYQTGCKTYLNEVILETILIAASVLLSIAVFELVGMINAFTLTRLIRRTTYYRNVQKWKTLYQNDFDEPSFVNYTPLHN